MGSTTLGIVYPDAAAVPSRSQLQQLATSADAAIATTINAKLVTGAATVTTDAAGFATISHALGRVPTFNAANAITSTYTVYVTSRTASTLTVKVVTTTSGAALASTSITIMWLCV